MPKFLYTIVLFSLIGWGSVAWILYNTKPETVSVLLAFLFLLFITLTITLSIPFYVYLYKRAPEYSNLRNLYRRGLKYSSFLGFVIAAFFGLKAFSLDNYLTNILFIVFCVMLFLRVRGR